MAARTPPRSRLLHHRMRLRARPAHPPTNPTIQFAGKSRRSWADTPEHEKSGGDNTADRKAVDPEPACTGVRDDVPTHCRRGGECGSEYNREHALIPPS